MAGDPPRFGAADLEVLDATVCHRGFCRVERRRVRSRLFRGGWSEPVEREVLDRGHAAAVLLYDPDLDRVVLVEQCRPAVADAPGGPWLVETVAGVIGDGETPEAVVRREAREEADSRVGRLVRVSEVMPSPGACGERLALYCGGVDAADAGGVHGLADDGEDIRVVAMAADDAIAAVAAGRIVAANAVIPLQRLALDRDRPRRAWRG